MSNNATENSASRRIATVLDEGSFVEIGGAVTARNTDFNLQEKETPADGVITGYGVIDGNLVYVYSQDASVLKGAIGEMHAKKIANIYDMAMKMGAPGHRFDRLRRSSSSGSDRRSGGVRKSVLQTGNGFRCDSSDYSCFRYVRRRSCSGAWNDRFTFMESKEGKLFVNSPNALEGNIDSKCDTASAEYQSRTAGLVDAAGTEEEILGQIRSLICMLTANFEDDASYRGMYR